jgi:hypothetical protein
MGERRRSQEQIVRAAFLCLRTGEKGCSGKRTEEILPTALLRPPTELRLRALASHAELDARREFFGAKDLIEPVDVAVGGGSGFSSLGENAVPTALVGIMAPRVRR